MSDDLATVNMRQGERAREIEILRQRYRRHREALNEMAADAPTEHLSSEYQRLIQELDGSLAKLDELEGRPGRVPPPVAPAANEPSRAHGDPLGGAASPGMRPLAGAPEGTRHGVDTGHARADESREARSRLPLILLAAVVALGLIGWLIWRTSATRNGDVAGQTATVPIETETAPLEPIPDVGDPLTVSPPSQNYGVIRKGTRATRQFEITNTTDEPISPQLARSTCRCLYYEHADVIPPNAKESLTVTVDGARAPAGELRETVQISAKGNPEVSGTVEVIATIR